MEYYVHTLKDAQGDYEVHKEGCQYMPLPSNRLYLGNFIGCHSAVLKARSLGYVPANGCFWCSRECHTS